MTDKKINYIYKTAKCGIDLRKEIDSCVIKFDTNISDMEDVNSKISLINIFIKCVSDARNNNIDCCEERDLKFK